MNFNRRLKELRKLRALVQQKIMSGGDKRKLDILTHQINRSIHEEHKLKALIEENQREFIFEPFIHVDGKVKWLPEIKVRHWDIENAEQEAFKILFKKYPEYTEEVNIAYSLN